MNCLLCANSILVVGVWRQIGSVSSSGEVRCKKFEHRKREKTEEDKSDRNISSKNILFVISVDCVKWWWKRRRWARNRKSLSVVLFLSALSLALPLFLSFSLCLSLLFSSQCYCARRLLRYRHFIPFLFFVFFFFLFFPFLSLNARWDLTFLNNWLLRSQVSWKKNETTFVMRWLNTFNSIFSSALLFLVGRLAVCLPASSKSWPGRKTRMLWCAARVDWCSNSFFCRSIDRCFDMQHCSPRSFSTVIVVIVFSPSDILMLSW